MRAQKNHKKTSDRLYHLPKIRSKLSFYGGAYSKFGMIDPKEMYERQNTKIKIIK